MTVALGYNCSLDCKQCYVSAFRDPERAELTGNRGEDFRPLILRFNETEKSTGFDGLPSGISRIKRFMARAAGSVLSEEAT